MSEEIKNILSSLADTVFIVMESGINREHKKELILHLIHTIYSFGHGNGKAGK